MSGETYSQCEWNCKTYWRRHCMVLEVGRRRCSRWRQQTDGPLYLSYNTKRSQLCLPLPLTIPTMPCCRLQTPPWKPPERHQWNASSWSLSKYWIHVCVAHFNLSKHTFSRLQNDKSAFKRNCTVEQTCFGRFFLKALMKFFFPELNSTDRHRGSVIDRGEEHIISSQSWILPPVKWLRATSICS